MPIDRPRRIFRSGHIASRQGRTGFGTPFVAGVAGLVAAVCILALGHPAALFGRVPAVSGTLIAEPDEVAVVDGETLRVRGTVVRLFGLAAPARGAECLPQTDCGAAAAQSLAGLIRDRQVICDLDGRDRDGFPQAICTANGTTVNRALISAGYARASGDAGAFSAAEQQARRDRAGLWKDGGFL